MKASFLRCLGHFDYATSHRSITNARRSVLRLPGRRNSWCSYSIFRMPLWSTWRWKVHEVESVSNTTDSAFTWHFLGRQELYSIPSSLIVSPITLLLSLCFLKLQSIRLAAQRSDVSCSMEPDLLCVRSAVSQDLSDMELKHDQHSLPFSSFCFSCPSVLSSNDNLFSGALRSHWQLQ